MSSPSAGIDPHDSTHTSEFCSFTLGERLAKIKKGDINSRCSQSRTLCPSQVAKGELGINPTGRQQRIWGLCMYTVRNETEKSIHF